MRVGIGERGQSKTNVFHYFHKHAARAEHDHRAVLRIGGDAADKLTVALDHFLNDDAFKSIKNAALFEFGYEIAVLRAQFLVRADVHAHASHVGLVRRALGGHLHHDGVAHFLSGSYGFVFTDDKACPADPHAVGLEYVETFARGELQAPFGLHGGKDVAHG